MSGTNKDSAEETFRHAIQESIKVKAKLVERHISIIAHIAGLLIDTFQSGGKVVLFSNGGSAADAQRSR